MKNNILFIARRFYPDSVGGSETYMLNLIDFPGKYKILVNTCLNRTNGKFDKMRNYASLRRGFIEFRPLGALRRTYMYLRWFIEIITIIYKKKIKLIISGQTYPEGLLCMAVKKLFGIPYVVIVYGEEITLNMGKERVRKILKTIFEYADRIVSISEYTASVISDIYKKASGKIEIVTPGVELKSLPQIETIEKLKFKYGLSGKKIILTVGRTAEKRKGIDLLIDAMPELLKKEKDAALIVVGERKEDDGFDERVAELGLYDKVRLTGKIPRDMVEEYFQISEMFAMPNRRIQYDNGSWDDEGFGIVFLEANSYGKPCIAGRSGGAIEALEDGMTGLLVDGNSKTDVMEKILKLLADRELAGRMGRNALERVKEKFRWEERHKNITALFDGVIEKRIVRKKTRVLQSIYNFNAGGAQQVIIDICKNARQEEFDFTVLLINEAGILTEHLKRLGIKYISVDKRITSSFMTFIKLWRIIRRGKYDVVHTHCFAGNVFVRIVAVLKRIPVIVHTVHNTSDWERWYHILIDRVLFAFTDSIAIISEQAKRSLMGVEKISSAKLKVILNGIDVDRTKHLSDADLKKKEIGLGPNKLTVGLVGRITEQKGQKYFVESAERVLNDRKDVQFVIVGKGDEEGLIKDIVERKRLYADMIFTGERIDVLDIINTFDLFVMSSLWEGLPIVLLEAMLLKKAVVVTSVGGIPEVIETGINGILVPPRDPEAIARAIMQLLDDASARARMGENAYGTVRERFDVSKMVMEYEKLYRKY